MTTQQMFTGPGGSTAYRIDVTTDGLDTLELCIASYNNAIP